MLIFKTAISTKAVNEDIIAFVKVENFLSNIVELITGNGIRNKAGVLTQKANPRSIPVINPLYLFSKTDQHTTDKVRTAQKSTSKIANLAWKKMNGENVSNNADNHANEGCFFLNIIQKIKTKESKLKTDTNLPAKSRSEKTRDDNPLNHINKGGLPSYIEIKGFS